MYVSNIGTMGVPGLFTFLQRVSRRAVKDLQHGENLEEEVDYLLLDSNGLLHAAAQFVFNYGEYKRIIYPYANLSFDEKMRMVMNIFFENILIITELIRPRKVLYIALDGPAPKGKQNQQRQRRFGSTRGTNEFDSNCITPGSQFMNDIGMYMLYRIRKEINTNKRWQGINVIYSSVNVPGEGEHKLMDYVRALPKVEHNSTFCYVGPDGDLIMLALAIGLDNVKLLRQDQYRPGFYKLIDVGNTFSYDIHTLFGGKTIQDSRNEFNVSGLFVGNDFLPRVQMFVTVNDGLEFMREMRSKTPGELLTKNSHINIKGLSTFVTSLAKREEGMLLESVLTTDPRKLPPEGETKYINTLLIKYVKPPDPRGSRFQKFTLDYEGYRKEYYSSKLGFGEDRVQELCADYVKTLVWVYEYYSNGLPDWNWSYMHHYPPMMKDLDVYLRGLVSRGVEGVEFFEFNLGTPSRPFEQLLSVLPPTSAALLPSSYGKLLSQQPLIEYCPTSFEVDYEGKIKEHEGIALLPFVDYRLVREVYSSVAGRPFHRDSVGTSVTFRYDDTYFSTFESKYGKIEDNQVVVV